MMDYADVKRRKILKLLKWLKTLSGFSVGNGGHHQWLVKYSTWPRPYPIPFKHGTVSRYIVKALKSRVIATGACTEEQFDERIK